MATSVSEAKAWQIVEDPSTTPTAAKNLLEEVKILGVRRPSHRTTAQYLFDKLQASDRFGLPILPSATALAQQPAVQAR